MPLYRKADSTAPSHPDTPPQKSSARPRSHNSRSQSSNPPASLPPCFSAHLHLVPSASNKFPPFVLRFLCIIRNSLEASPKVAQEECSTQLARPSLFRAAPSHNPRDERGQSALAAAHAHFSPAPASLPPCLPVPTPDRGTCSLLRPPAPLRHPGALKACHQFLTDAKILEIYLTRLISSTSIFLIDKFSRYFKTFPICAALRANPPASSLQLAPRSGPPASALSNRNSKILEFPLTHRKQSLGQFLIATFRALFCPAAREIGLGSPSARNQLAPAYVLNPAFGGCNLPCRP